MIRRIRQTKKTKINQIDKEGYVFLLFKTIGFHPSPPNNYHHVIYERGNLTKSEEFRGVIDVKDESSGVEKRKKKRNGVKISKI